MINRGLSDLRGFLHNVIYSLGYERRQTGGLTQLLILLRNILLDPFDWNTSRHEFLDRLAHVQSAQDAITLDTQFKGKGFYRDLAPIQDDFEIKTLTARIQAIAPKVIVEIGTRSGGTLFIWSQSSEQLELLVSIDLPGGIYGGGYPPQRSKLYHLFTTNHPKCRLELLRRDSQTEATRALLLTLLQGRPIDFLFIDGDHRYTGVKLDYGLYADLVRPGGLVAFHDVIPNPSNNTDVQVFKLWDELKATNIHTEEIINKPNSRYGIGLITR